MDDFCHLIFLLRHVVGSNVLTWFCEVHLLSVLLFSFSFFFTCLIFWHNLKVFTLENGHLLQYQRAICNICCTILVLFVPVFYNFSSIPALEKTLSLNVHDCGFVRGFV